MVAFTSSRSFLGAELVRPVKVLVTEGIGLGVYFGFNTGWIGFPPAIGSINIVKFKGVTIEGLNFLNDTVDAFHVSLKGNLPKSFFKGVQPQDYPSFLDTSTPVHTYYSTQDVTLWSWQGVVIPARWDGSGVSWVILTK